MINDGYLIPANTKRGELIFGVFTMSGLIAFATGILVSLILLLIFGTENTIGAIICLLPGLVSGFLFAIPIANYRNAFVFFKSMYQFYRVEQQVYRWKGWCYNEQTKK